MLPSITRPSPIRDRIWVARRRHSLKTFSKEGQTEFGGGIYRRQNGPSPTPGLWWLVMTHYQRRDPDPAQSEMISVVE